MTTPTSPVVPAGWYQDPENPTAQRYWDGSAWTEHRINETPLPDPPSTPQQAPSAPPFVGPAPMPAPPVGYGYGQFGTVVPTGMYFDQASGLILPEGVQLASVGRRIGAYFLAIPLAIGTLFIGYLIWGLIVWGRGQTPAQQVLGMRCWRPETQRVAGWWWMALREIVGTIAEGILSFISQIVSFILMLTGKERKSLHDHIAGTVVLHDPNKILAS
jgi:uncharacterized RDD family membrane protein YckC